MKNFYEALLDNGPRVVKEYWLPIIMLVLVAGVSALLLSGQSKQAELEAAIIETEDRAVKLERDLEGINTDFDKAAHQEALESRQTSARAISNELIKLEEEMATYYKRHDPLPKKDAESIEASLAEAELRWAEITREDASMFPDTWQLNADWDVELISVAAYADAELLPIVFEMTTESGDRAGLIYAVYNDHADVVTNISKYYTPEGRADATSIGGR